VCERYGGKIPARPADDAGGKIAVWSCSARLEAVGSEDRYWWIAF
jgi:hypothetical protein